MAEEDKPQQDGPAEPPVDAAQDPPGPPEEASGGVTGSASAPEGDKQPPSAQEIADTQKPEVQEKPKQNGEQPAQQDDAPKTGADAGDGPPPPQDVIPREAPEAREEPEQKQQEQSAETAEPSPPAEPASSEASAPGAEHMKELESLDPAEADIIRQMLGEQGLGKPETQESSEAPEQVVRGIEDAPEKAEASPTTPARRTASSNRRISVTRAIVLFNAVLGGAVWIVMVWMFSRGPAQAPGATQPPTSIEPPSAVQAPAGDEPPSAVQPTARVEPPSATRPPTHVEPPPVGIKRLPREPERPSQSGQFAQRGVSWKGAESAYLSKSYQQARADYKELLQNSRSRPADASVSDFLRLRIALCNKQLGETGEARRALRKVSQSGSPIVRAAGHYHLGEIDASEGLHLQARMRAYLAIAALGALERRSRLEMDCDFLIGRCLTEKAFSFRNSDVSIPWGRKSPTDPFEGLDDVQLRTLLEEGANPPNDEGLLGPQVQSIGGEGLGPRFSVACIRAPLVELLHRFTDATDIDVEWVSVPSVVRGRAVSLYHPSIPAHRLSEVACGAVGLVSRFTGDKALVHDPQSCDSLIQQQELLHREAESVWRRFVLRALEDPRLPQVYFALGCLRESSGDTVGAMRDHKMAAHRFPKSPVASAALLRCAKLRIAHHDYQGAREDLNELLDRYPNCQQADQIHLSLGEATMKVGLYDQAIQTFRKLYYMELSASSRRAACLGIGRCLYQTGKYDEAGRWLNRYIGLVEDSEGGELSKGLYLLGKSQLALGNVSEAIRIFCQVLLTKPSRQQRMDTILELGRVQMQRKNFVSAIGVLERLENLDLSPQQHYEFLMLRSQLYRAVGLSAKAARILREGMTSVRDPGLRAQLSVELAGCHVDLEDLSSARRVLVEALPSVEHGTQAYDAVCVLAKTCLESGELDQAVVVATELLKSDCPPDIYQRARQILGAAYMEKKDYERAALVLSGVSSEKPKEGKL